MGQLAVAGGGAAVGAIVGSFIPGVGTLIGAQVGWALGGVAGALLFPPKLPDTHGPRLNDLTIQTSGYGVPIALVAERGKLAGNLIWAPDIIEEVNTRKVSGGKGGPTQKVTEYSYYGNFAVGLCEWLIQPQNPAVLKIWLDNILVYDVTGESEVTQIPGLAWRFYPGSDTQTPDPLIESYHGADAPYHRDLCYIVFERLPLDRFGNSRLPNVTVEVTANASETFPETLPTDPPVTLFPSSPGGYTYIGHWQVNVAIDRRRGRIYECRRKTTGGSSVTAATSSLIRVYDLVTLEGLTEHLCADMVPDSLLPPGYTGADAAISGGHMVVGEDGFLYMVGGDGNRYPVWKINPDSMKAVDVFGNPLGSGLGFGDRGAWVINPMQMKHFQVPRLGMTPRNFLLIQGTYSFTLILDADFMEYVWGAGDVATSPPVEPLGLGISPLSFPCQIVVGKTREDGGVEIWALRGFELSTPARIEVTRFRVYSGAAALGPSAAMGIFRDDYADIDVQAELSASIIRPILHAAWWDFTDDTLVMTITGTGGPVSNWGFPVTFKWAPGGGVVWKVVNHAFEPNNDGRGDMGNVRGPTWGLAGNLLVQTGTGDALVNQSDASSMRNLFWLDDQQGVIGYNAGSQAGVSSIKRRLLNRKTAGSTTVEQVVRALCLRANLSLSDINTAELAADTIPGYMLGNPVSGRDAITPLAGSFFFDAVEEDDQIKFKKRGRSTVATITYDELLRESEDRPALEETRAQDQDLPRRVSVRFRDIERNWEQNAQSWQRPRNPTPVVYSDADVGIDLGIPMTATAARTIAKRMVVALWRERTKFSFSLPTRYLRLSPVDPILLETRDGGLTRLRIHKTGLGANWAIRVEAGTEDGAAYGTTVDGDSGSGYRPPTLPQPYYTALLLPDMALVQDSDDLDQGALREYAFALPYREDRWRGITLFRSENGSSWQYLTGMTSTAAWGAVLVDPTEPAGLWQIDEVGTITVRLLAGSLDSITEAELLNDGNLAALIGPDGTAELFQFQTATDNGDGTYTLSTLVRGRRGTEDLISSRAAGDTFVLLTPDIRMAFSGRLGTTTAIHQYKPLSVYASIDTAPTFSKSRRGRAEQPYAVCNVTGARDGGNNLTISWVRRTRAGGEWVNGEEDVPLSEASEAYEVDIYSSSSFSSVLRTLTVSGTPSVVYSAAQQATDFGAPQSMVYCRIYQMSAIVGRGVAKEASI